MKTQNYTRKAHTNRHSGGGFTWADVKNSTIGFNLNFDIDIKKTTARHQCENRFTHTHTHAHADATHTSKVLAHLRTHTHAYAHVRTHTHAHTSELNTTGL